MGIRGSRCRPRGDRVLERVLRLVRRVESPVALLVHLKPDHGRYAVLTGQEVEQLCNPGGLVLAGTRPFRARRLGDDDRVCAVQRAQLVQSSGEDVRRALPRMAVAIAPVVTVETKDVDTVWPRECLRHV